MKKIISVFCLLFVASACLGQAEYGIEKVREAQYNPAEGLWAEWSAWEEEEGATLVRFAENEIVFDGKGDDERYRIVLTNMRYDSEAGGWNQYEGDFEFEYVTQGVSVTGTADLFLLNNTLADLINGASNPSVNLIIWLPSGAGFKLGFTLD